MPPVPPVPPRAGAAASGQSGEGVPPPEQNGPPPGTIDPQQIADAVGKAASAFIDGFFNRRR
jgi:hypothetical protein